MRLSYYLCALFLGCSLAAFAQSASDLRLWEQELKKPHLTVVDKAKCFSGDPHNYESLAYYAWPDPADSTAAYIWKDGQPSPEYNKYDGIKLSQLKDRVRVLKEAYVATADRRYLDCCISQLNMWFADKNTAMNPHLDYGQFIPGDRNGLGHAGAISEAYNFVLILDYIDELKEHKAIPSKVDRKMKKWFKKMSAWLHGSSLGNEMHDVKDNLAIMYDVLAYRIAQFTGDKKTRKRIRGEFPQLRLATHIADDGSQPRELLRTKAMMYSIYNLRHIVYFCQMQQHDGVDFYAANRQRIDAAVEYLGRYIDSPETFPYQEIGDWNVYRLQYKELLGELSTLR